MNSKHLVDRSDFTWAERLIALCCGLPCCQLPVLQMCSPVKGGLSTNPRCTSARCGWSRNNLLHFQDLTVDVTWWKTSLLHTVTNVCDYSCMTHPFQHSQRRPRDIFLLPALAFPQFMTAGELFGLIPCSLARTFKVWLFEPTGWLTVFEPVKDKT